MVSTRAMEGIKHNKKYILGQNWKHLEKKTPIVIFCLQNSRENNHLTYIHRWNEPSDAIGIREKYLPWATSKDKKKTPSEKRPDMENMVISTKNPNNDI